MTDSIFKGVEIVGTSHESFSHAIEAAVARARRTLHNLSWFVVEEMRGGLQQGQLQYQVTLRVFFKLDEIDEGGGGAGQPDAGAKGEESGIPPSPKAAKKAGSAVKGRNTGRR